MVHIWISTFQLPRFFLYNCPKGLLINARFKNYIQFERDTFWVTFWKPDQSITFKYQLTNNRFQNKKSVILSILSGEKSTFYSSSCPHFYWTNFKHSGCVYDNVCSNSFRLRWKDVPLLTFQNQWVEQNDQEKSKGEKRCTFSKKCSRMFFGHTFKAKSGQTYWRGGYGCTFLFWLS